MKTTFWPCRYGRYLLLIIPLMVMSLSFTPSKSFRIVFFGDSITELGEAEGGYIDLMRKDIARRGLDNRYEVIGAGVSGNKVYDLFLRLDEDVLSRKPDMVFIYIGINDVWHKQWGTGTDADKFERFYRAIIRKIKNAGADPVLCTPTVIGERTDFTNQPDGDLNLYAKIVRKIAEDELCKLIDLRAVFLDYNLQHNPDNLSSGILTTDGVHLNDAGNRLVAETFLSEVFPK